MPGGGEAAGGGPAARGLCALALPVVLANLSAWLWPAVKRGESQRQPAVAGTAAPGMTLWQPWGGAQPC